MDTCFCLCLSILPFLILYQLTFNLFPSTRPTHNADTIVYWHYTDYTFIHVQFSRNSLVARSESESSHTFAYYLAIRHQTRNIIRRRRRLITLLCTCAYSSVVLTGGPPPSLSLRQDLSMLPSFYSQRFFFRCCRRKRLLQHRQSVSIDDDADDDDVISVWWWQICLPIAILCFGLFGVPFSHSY